MKSLLGFSILMITLTACQPQLSEGGKIRPFQKTSFFADHASARPRPEGVISRDDQQMGEEPEVSEDRLYRGKELYEIHCKVCHGLDGRGNGMAVLRGFPRPPDLNSPEFIKSPTSHFYKVITEGKGKMFAFANRLRSQDRWSIAQYVRALQVQQSFPQGALSARDSQKLKEAKK